jgi:hypothetical protein
VSDITPKSIAPPSGVMPTLPSAAPPATTNTATAAEIPAAVANLSVGAFITGTVIERSARGLVVLRTDKGTIKLQTPVLLKPGSTVTLQIQTVGAQVQLSILSVDGQPLAAPGKYTPATTRPDAATRTAPSDASPLRPPAAPANASLSPQKITDTPDGALVRSLPADRPTPDRAAPPRAAGTQPSVPAPSFVARPLTQISSAVLEALSSMPPMPPPASPSTAALAVPSNAAHPTSAAPAASAPATAAPVATPPAPSAVAPGSVTHVATTITPATVTAGSQAPAPAAPAIAPAVHAASAQPQTAVSSPATAVTTTTAAAIVPGSRFTASFVAPPPIESAEVADMPAAPPRSANPSASPSAPPLPPATTAPVPGGAAINPVMPPPVLPADRVILRLLGMTEPPRAAPSGTASMTIAKPLPAPGVTVAPEALTTTGTIVDGGDLPHLPQPAGPASTRTWIATPFGLLTAAGPPPGPVGTRLLLEVVLRGAGADPAPPLAPSPMPSSALLPPATTLSATSTAETSWPALRDIMSVVQTVAPDAAERLANVTLPRIGPSLAAGIMAFVAAVRQGSPRSWLGEQTVESLHHAGHGALVDRLSDEFAGAARLAATPGPQGWQALLLPLYDGEQLRQLRLYWQRQRRKDNQRKPGTRFVVEAELTTLGLLQLDGMFNKPQFDLVVRSSTSLPAQVRGDIVEIFGDALLATNLKGAVSFQTNTALRAGPPTGDAERGPEPGVGLIV